MVEYLLDANVLLYPYDRREPGKADRADEVIEILSYSDSAAISVQGLAEFLWNATRKIPGPMPHDYAETRLRELAAAFRILDMTLPIVLEAARGAAEHHLSYWDAQVWATAKLNQIPVVLRENMHGRESLEAVRFINPFAQGFDISTLTARR
jgi:predicted nucleic acid-binding protein